MPSRGHFFLLFLVFGLTIRSESIRRYYSDSSWNPTKKVDFWIKIQSNLAFSSMFDINSELSTICTLIITQFLWKEFTFFLRNFGFSFRVGRKSHQVYFRFSLAIKLRLQPFKSKKEEVSSFILLPQTSNKIIKFLPPTWVSIERDFIYLIRRFCCY